VPDVREELEPGVRDGAGELVAVLDRDAGVQGAVHDHGRGGDLGQAVDGVEGEGGLPLHQHDRDRHPYRQADFPVGSQVRRVGAVGG
jgi:hypothetical protein